MMIQHQKICQYLRAKFDLGLAIDRDEKFVNSKDQIHSSFIEFEGSEENLQKLKTWVLSIQKSEPKREFQIRQIPNSNRFAIEIGAELKNL